MTVSRNEMNAEADGAERVTGREQISHDPTQRAEATTTPEGAKGRVDQAGSAQVLAGGHGLDVTPDASPGGSEQRPASEQDGGGKPSTAPDAALAVNADGPGSVPAPDDDMGFNCSGADYHLPACGGTC